MLAWCIVRQGTHACKGRDACAQIVVHGLPWSVEWQDLKDLAKQHGDVVKADVVKRSDGKSRGFGTVVFKTAEDAQQAIQVCLVVQELTMMILT